MAKNGPKNGQFVWPFLNIFLKILLKHHDLLLLLFFEKFANPKNGQKWSKKWSNFESSSDPATNNGALLRHSFFGDIGFWQHPPLNLPGWCWARIKQLALIGSSSSLHSEACKALGGSDGVVHSTISLAAICMRAVAKQYRKHWEAMRYALFSCSYLKWFWNDFLEHPVFKYHLQTLLPSALTFILAEGAIALLVTLSGSALFASWKLLQFPSRLIVKVIRAIFRRASAQQKCNHY